MRSILRTPAVVLAGASLALITGLVPARGLALTHDNLADAQFVPGLPFSDASDLAGTSTEIGEPTQCVMPLAQSAWYAFTAPASGPVKVDMFGSSPPVSAAVYMMNGPGFGGLSWLGCASAYGTSYLLDAVAASTYYIQVASPWTGPATYQLQLLAMAPPANDDLVDRISLVPPEPGLPTSTVVDVLLATLEDSEPLPSPDANRSVWYELVSPTTRAIAIRTSHPSSWVAVYTGTTFGDLVTKASAHTYSSPATFQAQAGVTYLVQLATGPMVPMFGSAVTVTLEVPPPAPPPTAAFTFWPNDPSVYDTVNFADASMDPAGMGIALRQWDFGDGTTAGTPSVDHRFAADGTYDVSLTVTTPDERTATASQRVVVQTHDVAIVRFQAPSSARAGQQRILTVDLRGGRYDEQVQVDLYRSAVGQAETLVSSQTLPVPARLGARTTRFELPYLFTAQDAAGGKLTFRVVASIAGFRDAFAGDNQATAPPTKVAS